VILSGARRRHLVAGVLEVGAVIAAIVVLGLALDLVFSLPRFSSLFLTWLGGALMVIAILLEGRATYGLWTFGAGTPNPAAPPTHLVTKGPYRYSRNPLYVARLLFLWGASLVLGSPGVLTLSVLLLFALHFVVVPREEGRLAQRFGGSYDEYRRSVPRWIGVRRMRPPSMIRNEDDRTGLT